MGRVVDAHTHFIPPELLEEAGRRAWNVTIERRENTPWIVHDEGYAYPWDPMFAIGEEKLRDMDDRGIDVSVVSVSPTIFFYWLDSAECAAFCRFANDALAERIATSDRFSGLATLPMMHPEAAADELRRAVRELGLAGAEIGTSIEGVLLDDPRFEPVWEAADELGVPLFLHPYYVGPRSGYESYYLTNTFVNPLDTAHAAARLIFGGVLARYPRLVIMLAHGGGFLPYQIGRLDHGWTVREEPKVRLDRPPSEYLRRFYFDSITHHDAALAWLVELVGADRVVLGSDLPFDMADADPVGRARRALSDGTASEVEGATATALFGLEGALQARD